MAPQTPQISHAGGGQSGSDMWSPGTPRTPSQVARVRYRQNEYFRLWRRGRKDEWQAPRWRIAVDALPARRGGVWDGQPSAQSGGAARRRADNRTSIRGYPSASGAGPPGPIAATTGRMVASLPGASLVKVLGYGGQGVACLVEIAGAGARPGQLVAKRVVMKMSIGDDDWSAADEDLRTEKKWQVSLGRAMHVVQLKTWSCLRGGTSGPGSAPSPEDVCINNNPRIFFMELMRNGDLHGVVERASNRGEKLPSRLLWKIFACLIRGCIAMRYPPRLRRIISRTQEDWTQEDGPDILEQVPADPCSRAARDYDLVHFDLDPKNVFIGDTDDRGHGNVPRFKVADLGLAERTSGDLLTTAAVWTSRQRGKPDFYLPEQYHQEWEWAGPTPGQQRPRLQVAANYGSWSNVYHIAMCMHILITLYTFPYPPQPSGPYNHPDGPGRAGSLAVGGTGTGTGTDVRDYWGRRVQPFYSNGGDLASEAGLDARLGDLLLRCLAVLPAHRPGLAELEAWARDAEGSAGFFDGIGGDITTGELAERFITRPGSPHPPASSLPGFLSTVRPDGTPFHLGLGRT